jgi:PmbA protein
MPTSVTENTLLTQAKDAARLAQKLGADDARVGVSRSRGVEVEWRDGRLERVQERTRRGLSVELFVDGRYAAMSTNDLRPSAVEAFLTEAVAMTRVLEPDEHRRLPDPARYAGRASVDLDLADASQAAVTSEQRRASAEQLEALLRARSANAPIVSVTSAVEDDSGESARVHTNGFEGVRQGTHFSRSVQVTLIDQDGRRPMGWAYTVRRHQAELEAAETIVDRARDMALRQLGAGKLATGKYTLVVDRQSVPRLLGAFLGPLSGAALQQKRSLWDGKLGERIASPLLTIVDEPHKIRGLGSALWDGDGFATHRRAIIEAGVLKTYLIDDYYARKMGVEPTGGSTHNFEWALGTRDADGLVADVGEGVYIDRFLGGNSNGTTGEISMGCAGRVIRGGRLCEPVAEVNLAGHFGEIWQALVAVGNDPDPNGSAAAPTCVFEGIQLSGV